MLKRSLACIAAAVLICGAFAGCSTSTTTSNTSATSSAKAPVTITFWNKYPEDTEKTSYYQRFLAWAKNFNATNTDNITVKVTGSKAPDAVLTAISGGDTPDIFLNYWNNTSTWADKGALLDLTNYISNDKDYNVGDFLDGTWTQSTYKGKRYSIPFLLKSSELYYRKDILKKYGYDSAPNTIEKLKEMAIAMTKYDSTGAITQAGFLPSYPYIDNVLWPVASGAYWIDENTNKITFNSAKMQAAYQWQADIFKALGYDKTVNFVAGFGTTATAEDPLLQGKIAMMFRAESVINGLVQYGSNVDWAVAAIPTDTNDVFMATNVLSINAHTAHPDAAWEVLSNLTSEAEYKELANGDYNTGRMFCRKSCLNYIETMSTAPQALKDTCKIMLSANLRGFPMSAYINQYLTSINDEMAKAFKGDITVSQACDNVVKTVQPLADASPVSTK